MYTLCSVLLLRNSFRSSQSSHNIIHTSNSQVPSLMMRPNTTGSLAYVRGNGRITRDSLHVARFSFVRLYCVVAIMAVLILTNPANGTHGLFPMSWWQNTTIGIPKGKSPNSTSTWFKFWLPAERTTNFGIFALQNSNRDATVRITGLLRSTILCHRNSSNELADTFCNAIGKLRQQ